MNEVKDDMELMSENMKFYEDGRDGFKNGEYWWMKL